MSLPEAASRTDRGVHSRGQVVQFSLKKQWALQKLHQALNAQLPSDIRVIDLFSEEFHPTLDAKRKEYHYRICLGSVQEPTARRYSWHFYYPIDRSKIDAEAKNLLGTHDFSAFSNEVEKNPICTLESITFNGALFQIQGDRFLYKMVRNLVGTLLYIGCAKIPGNIETILSSKDRKKAGVTAPAHGLYLNRVFY